LRTPLISSVRLTDSGTTRSGKSLYQRDLKPTTDVDHTYIYLGGSLVAKRTIPVGGGTAVIEYQHTDALGSPIATTNDTGAAVSYNRQTAYGEPADGSWENGPGFTGHVVDAGSRLVYMQQRYYDPSIGSFLSVDPDPVNLDTAWNFSRYAYADNNPYRFTDPDGRAACQDCSDYFVGTTLFLGKQAADAGKERGRYGAAVRNLAPDDSAGRSALKQESRGRTPSVVRIALEASRPSTDAGPGSGGRANVSNASANTAGTWLKVGGRLLVAGAVVQQANEIANSSEPAREVAGAGGMVLGAIGGGEVGVTAGAAVGAALGGPPGAAIGALVGGVAGSAAGGVVGENAAEAVYDRFR
jgi:RHS repeat-associated protein